MLGELIYTAKRHNSGFPYQVAFPHKHTLLALKNQLAKSRVPSDTGIRSDDYLNMAEKIARRFQSFQDEEGAIISASEGSEVQFTTPCYALLIALLCKHNRCLDMAGSGWNALLHASGQLANQSIGHGSGDCYNFYLVQALHFFSERFPCDLRLTAVRQRIALVDPICAYQDIYTPLNRNLSWKNIGNLCGEFLRYSHGIGDARFHDRYMEIQLRYFTADGMHLDTSKSMAYDLRSRLFLEIALLHGYQGRHRKALDIILSRGSFMSLFMQSPAGQIPTGGRGSQHVWADLQQVTLFEIAARRCATGGEFTYAGAFKRAAHLAFKSIQQWEKPGGRFSSLKNAVDVTEAADGTPQSDFCLDNITIGTLLVQAAEYADESIFESATPSESGSYTLSIPTFDKIFASHYGTGILIDSCADTRHGATGLVSVGQSGVPSVLGPSDVPSANDVPCSLGVAWQEYEGGDWVTLAEHGTYRNCVGKIYSTEQSHDSRSVIIEYKLPKSGHTVYEHYTLTLMDIKVTITVDGVVNALRLNYPCHVSNGKTGPQISVEGNTLQSSLFQDMRVWMVHSETLNGIQVNQERIPYPCGFLIHAYAITKGNTVSYTLSSSTLMVPETLGYEQNIVIRSLDL